MKVEGSTERKLFRVFSYLHSRLKNQLIMRYLNKRNIVYDGLPSFRGRWPDIKNAGRMTIGSECTFRAFRLRQTITIMKDAVLEIGEDSFFNDGLNVCAASAIMIGCHADIGDMVYIYDTDFHQVSPRVPVKTLPVKIGNHVWIGTGSIVLPGSRIGDYAVIGAGSIVTGEIPARSLAVGTPARVIKELDVPDGWARR
jgi:acetyltransferase-like isoleucine patch superfamily enzyme